LRHLLPVGLRVQGSLSQEDGVLFWSNTEFIVEGVVPYFLHVVPVGDYTVLDRVFQSKDTAFGLGFVTCVFALSKEGQMKQKLTRHKNLSDPYQP
jgi:hypothetical protein